MMYGKPDFASSFSQRVPISRTPECPVSADSGLRDIICAGAWYGFGGAHGYQPASESKTLWRVKRTGHLGTFPQAAYRQQLVEWLERLARH